MMRRYEDAIKVFVDALIYIQRTRTMLQAPTRSLLNDMVNMSFSYNSYATNVKLTFNIFLLIKKIEDYKTKRANLPLVSNSTKLLSDENRRLD